MKPNVSWKPRITHLTQQKWFVPVIVFLLHCGHMIDHKGHSVYLLDIKSLIVRIDRWDIGGRSCCNHFPSNKRWRKGNNQSACDLIWTENTPAGKGRTVCLHGWVWQTIVAGTTQFMIHTKHAIVCLREHSAMIWVWHDPYEQARQIIAAMTDLLPDDVTSLSTKSVQR